MKGLYSVRLFLSLLAFFAVSQSAFGREYKFCWSEYIGWEPWNYISSSGILKRWATKYKVNISIVKEKDYVHSIEKYIQGEYYGCTMTNMDALTMPVVKGVDSVALIIGDFSNGNDGILVRDGTTVSSLKAVSYTHLTLPTT